MSDTSQTDAISVPPTAPTPTSGTSRVLISALWLSEASTQRLKEAFECEVVDDLKTPSPPDLVMMSTRIPKVQLGRIMTKIRNDVTCPVAIVCHAGGEEAAIELMSLGAVCIVAEGNESSLHRLLPQARIIEPTGDIEEEEGVSDEQLVSTLAQRLDSSTAGSRSGRGVDEITGLPSGSDFELRFAESGQQTPLPRLGFLRLANPEDTTDDLDAETMRLLRRRIATLIGSVARRYGVDLYTISNTDYAFMGQGLSLTRAEDFGRQVIQIGECFNPSGQDYLRMAVGHAGPEVASETRTLRELAERAVDGAIAGHGGVVSADDLSRSQASATELEAALRLAKRVDEIDAHSPGHSHRVADYAAEIAQELGIDGHELMRLRLACLLHDIGKVGLSAEAMSVDESSDSELVKEFQEHAERGYRYATLSAGEEVANAIRHHHERWDGSGFPQALEKEDIPILSRIISLADTYDTWTCESKDPNAPAPLTLDEVIEKLREYSGTWFDPMIVETSITLFIGTT
jgi:putative nucleotidyltransferase with HDIG domain